MPSEDVDQAYFWKNEFYGSLEKSIMSTTAKVRSSNVLFSAALEAEKHGMYAQADTLFDRAKHLHRQAGLCISTDFASRLLEFADLCIDDGRFERAESLYREVLAFFVEYNGENHLCTALTMRNLADVCSKLGKKSEAAELNFRAASILLKHRHLTGLNNRETWSAHILGETHG